MKRILVSLLTIVAVSAVGVAATRAFFSDTASSTGNTFTTGTLDVNIAGTGSTTNPYFNITGMVPGDSETSCLIVKNDGSLGMLFRSYADGVTDTNNLASQLDVTVTLRPTSGCDTPATYGVYGPANTVLWTGKLSQLIGTSSPLNNLVSAFGGDGVLPPHYAAVYGLTVSLPTTVGNTYQGATFTGALRVDAVQFENQTNAASVVWQ